MSALKLFVVGERLTERDDGPIWIYHGPFTTKDIADEYSCCRKRFARIQYDNQLEVCELVMPTMIDGDMLHLYTSATKLHNDNIYVVSPLEGRMHHDTTRSVLGPFLSRKQAEAVLPDTEVYKQHITTFKSPTIILGQPDAQWLEFIVRHIKNGQ
jgi:hypothetical protein